MDHLETSGRATTRRIRFHLLLRFFTPSRHSLCLYLVRRSTRTPFVRRNLDQSRDVAPIRSSGRRTSCVIAEFGASWPSIPWRCRLLQQEVLKARSLADVGAFIRLDKGESPWTASAPGQTKSGVYPSPANSFCSFAPDCNSFGKGSFEISCVTASPHPLLHLAFNSALPSTSLFFFLTDQQS